MQTDEPDNHAKTRRDLSTPAEKAILPGKPMLAARMGRDRGGERLEAGGVPYVPPRRHLPGSVVCPAVRGESPGAVRTARKAKTLLRTVSARPASMRMDVFQCALPR